MTPVHIWTLPSLSATNFIFSSKKQEIFRVTIVIWSLIVNWLRKLLYNSLCFCVSFIGDELVIANVQRNQDGNYYNCFAENLVRKSYKDVRLTVQCRCSHICNKVCIKFKKILHCSLCTALLQGILTLFGEIRCQVNCLIYSI